MDPIYTSQLLASAAVWGAVGLWARQWLAARDARRARGDNETGR
jgi:hypothetical protein